MAKQRVNIVASIKARLTNIARAKRMPFDLILIQYVLERILYRLSTSTHRDRFVLKGGMLLTTWIPDDARVTRDLDLLGYGEASEEAIEEVFTDLFAMEAEDGLAFVTKDMRIAPIREEMEYGGLTAEFGNDETKARQWRLYLGSLGVEAVVDLPTAISRITDYVLPASKFAAQSSDRKT